MRLLVDIIDWEYPNERVEYQPSIWDLRNNQRLMALVLSFGNGIILEFRAEAETIEARDALIGIALHTGSCKKVIPPPNIQKRLWFYDPAYECYQQGINNPGYIFIHPEPQPHKFPAQ